MHLLWLKAPEIAAEAVPGQFVMVACGESHDPLLRRPLSIHRLAQEGETEKPFPNLALLFAVVGRGTKWLSQRKEGDFLDLFGPVGKGFTPHPASRNLLLVAGGLHEPLGKAGPWVVGAIGILGVIFGGLAAMWLNQVKGGDLAKKWSDERAKAEAKRLAYFKSIMEGASDESLEQLLVLEYTRRFLLDNQIDYFRDRGGQHESAAGIALKKSTQAVFVASTFTAVAGLLSMLVPQLAVIAGLGVIASAYATLAVSRSAVNLDRKNADRYRVAEDQLKERKLDIDTYREKTASGDKGAVQEFFEPIFVTLEADHKGFLSDAEQRELAIGAMEKRLDAAKEALSKKSAVEADNR